MDLLQGHDIQIAVFLDIFDALGSCSCSSHRRDVRDLGFDGSLSQVTVIVNAALACRCVDYQIDLAVGDQV